MKIHLYSFAIFLLVGMPIFANAQQGTQSSEELSKSYYYSAKRELEDMLNGKQPLSYEKAIYLIENTWYDNRISYAVFQDAISYRVALIKQMADQRRGVPEKTQSKNFFDQLRDYNQEKERYYDKALMNWGIYSYMTDTALAFATKEGEKYFIYKAPLSYSTNDPLGSTDWTNTQVTNLLLDGRGNCFALASLFKIFADRLHTDAKICTAPGHIYICHKDDKGREFNVEIASKTFPGIGTLSTLTHTTQDAIVNDISLRQLNEKQSVALCLVYLAKGYEHKFNLKENDGFMMDCTNTALKSDSLNLNAMLLKAEILEGKLISQGKTVAQLQTSITFKDYEQLVKRLYSLGYREMPLSMKNILFKGWMRDTVATLAAVNYRLAEANENSNTQVTRKASLSWGLFEEEITDKPMEKYGCTVFDTKRKKITKFVKEDRLYNDYNFDPVLFALNIDPLAHKYPSISPYVFCANNPIMYIDPDGAEIVGVTRGDAIKMREDIYSVLSVPKFDQVRALIDVKGKTFKPIGAEALSTSLSGLSLSDDERTYIDMVTNTINSKDIYKVEYVSGEFTSDEGATAFRDHMNKAQAGIGDQLLTPEGKLSAGIINRLEGLNVPTKDGSHSFISSKMTGINRVITSGHELFGHGIPSAKKLSPQENNSNAIRTDNAIRRLLGQPERDGKDHNGYDQGQITEPQKLPLTK